MPRNDIKLPHLRIMIFAGALQVSAFFDKIVELFPLLTQLLSSRLKINSNCDSSILMITSYAAQV